MSEYMSMYTYIRGAGGCVTTQGGAGCLKGWRRRVVEHQRGVFGVWRVHSAGRPTAPGAAPSPLSRHPPAKPPPRSRLLLLCLPPRHHTPCVNAASTSRRATPTRCCPCCTRWAASSSRSSSPSSSSSLPSGEPWYSSRRSAGRGGLQLKPGWRGEGEGACRPRAGGAR